MQLAAFVYWLFWLVIPLLGFSWFFAWGFVDAVVAQRDSAAIAAARPFSDAAAQALGQPFAAGIWLGFTCWLVGSIAATHQNLRHYYRLRTDPQYRQARFLAANIEDAAWDTPGTTQARTGLGRVRGTLTRGSHTLPTDSGGAVEMV